MVHTTRVRNKRVSQGKDSVACIVMANVNVMYPTRDYFTLTLMPQHLTLTMLLLGYALVLT